MNKAQFVQRLSRRHPTLRKDECEALIEAMLEAMSHAVGSGRRIEIRGFGVFGARWRRSRIVINPRTRKPLVVPAHMVPYFRPGSPMHARLNRELARMRTRTVRPGTRPPAPSHTPATP